MDSEKEKNKSFFKEIYKAFVIASLIWLFFLLSFFWGYYVYSSEVWPYEILAGAEAYIKGDQEESSTLSEKILNDLRIKPSRFIENERFDLGKLNPVKELPLKSRRDDPWMYMSEEAPEGYRAIQGVFDFKKMLHGVILIDPNGKIENFWTTSQEDVDKNRPPDTLKYPHGFNMASDGSIIITFDGGSVLTKYSYCGEKEWEIEGRGLSHAISFEGDQEYVWLEGQTKERIGSDKSYIMLKVDYSNGDVVKEVAMEDMFKKNKDIDPFGLNQIDSDDSFKWIEDPFHFNDIEPLPKELEENYPLFEAGDLLLSFRNLNLVCVMDQETLEIKWWRQGLVRRQHDPDWNERGTITIFDNNMHGEFSRIVEIDPESYEYSVPVKGENYNFYSRIRGKHQLLPNGNFLITSSNQGRVFEVDENGDVVFDFLNLYNKDKDEYLVVSEAKFLPRQYFEDLPECE